MKSNFEPVELEVIYFDSMDIITTSCTNETEEGGF